MKKAHKKLLVAACGVLVFFGGACVLLPLFAKRSNCGGNSAALSYSRMISTGVRMICDEKGEFDINSLTAEERSDLGHVAWTFWIGDAHFLIRTNIAFENPREIVVVCDRLFSNVPQPTIWNLYRENPAHAVAYIDGHTALITSEQFKALDLSSFVDATALLTTNAVRK